jgi:hypothetical protein
VSLHATGVREKEAAVKWRIDGNKAFHGDGPESIDLDDVVKLDDDGMSITGMEPCGYVNVPTSFFVPKEILLELLRNAGWIDSEEDELWGVWVVPPDPASPFNSLGPMWAEIRKPPGGPGGWVRAEFESREKAEELAETGRLNAPPGWLYEARQIADRHEERSVGVLRIQTDHHGGESP